MNLTTIFARLQGKDGKAIGPSNPIDIRPAYSALTWTLTVVALTGASQELVAANPSRKAVRLHNRAGNADIYYRLDGGTVTSANGLPIEAKGQDILDAGHAGVAAITAIGTAAQSVNVWEAT